MGSVSTRGIGATMVGSRIRRGRGLPQNTAIPKTSSGSAGPAGIWPRQFLQTSQAAATFVIRCPRDCPGRASEMIASHVSLLQPERLEANRLPQSHAGNV